MRRFDDDYPPERNTRRREAPRDTRDRDDPRVEYSVRRTAPQVEQRDIRDTQDPRGPREIAGVRDPRLSDDPMETSYRVIASPDMMTDPRIDPRAVGGRRGEPVPQMSYTTRDTRDSRMNEFYDPPAGRLQEQQQPQQPPPQQRSQYSSPGYDDWEPPRGVDRRPVVDTTMMDDDSTNTYNTYFLPQEGIDRQVLQHEITKYLGHDATCHPWDHPDGRKGFKVRAYRPFTSEMIKSLKEESRKWADEQSRRRTQGRAAGTYADMRDRDTRRIDTMDMDDDSYRQQPARRHEPELDSRAPPVGRHASGNVQTQPAYQEPGYPPSYVPSAVPPGQYASVQSQPRTMYPGRSTPPQGGAGQPVYAPGQPGYPSRTVAPSTTMPSARFVDPRTGQATEPGGPYYTTDTRQGGGRHR